MMVESFLEISCPHLKLKLLYFGMRKVKCIGVGDCFLVWLGRLTNHYVIDLCTARNEGKLCTMVERLGEWFPFSSELYCRKLTLYDRMHWGERSLGINDGSLDAVSEPFSLVKCTIISPAPFGGSVAVLYGGIIEGTASDAASVDIYSSAGELQAKLCLSDDLGVAIVMGWTKEESLVVLTNRHVCIFFDTIVNGIGPSRKFFLQNSGTNHMDGLTSSIALFCISIDGIFYIDMHGRLCGVLHGERHTSEVIKPTLLKLDTSPITMDFIPAEWNDDGDTVVYIATRAPKSGEESMLYVFTSDRGYEERLRKSIPGDVLAMKVNNNGTRIACFTDSAMVFVFSSNLQTVDFALSLGKRGRKPEKLEWCGLSFIVLHFNEASFGGGYSSREEAPMFSLLIPTLRGVSVQCERLNWDDEGSGHVATVTEVDGLRVVTERSCYFIEEVPSSLIRLCRIKPISSSARLLAAYDDYANGGVKGLPDTRHLLSRWGNAAFAELLDEIIDAAAHEFSTDQQHRLLAAASFANEVNRQYDPDTLLDVVRRLRVLHAVRHFPGFQIPLSFRQYSLMSGAGQMRALSPSEAQVLVDRLTNRRVFQLALDITVALSMNSTRLLSVWSCHKLQDVALDDETVFAHITEVLNRHSGSSFVECAMTAFRLGRRRLAVKLLNEDFRVHCKVTQFLLLGEWELALYWAAQADDADLLQLALTRVLFDEVDREKKFKVLLRYPSAMAWLLLGEFVQPSWRPVVEELCTKHGDASLSLYFSHCCLLRVLMGKQIENQMMTSLEALKCDASASSEITALIKGVLCPSTASAFDDVLAAFSRCKQLRLNTVSGKSTSMLLPFFSPEVVKEETRWLSLQSELIQTQQKLAEEFNDHRFLGSSVTRTIYFCILCGADKKAEDIRAKYRVGERQYCYTRLLAFCDAGRWDDAEKLGGASNGRFSVKPAVGFLPFLEQFTHHGQVERAVKLVPALDSITQRLEWYMTLDRPMVAIDDAFHEQDPALIQQIMKKSRDTAVHEYGAKRLEEIARV